MLVRFENLTALLLSKDILNEADLDDIKNTEERIGQLRENILQDILLERADEGKPQ